MRNCVSRPGRAVPSNLMFLALAATLAIAPPLDAQTAQTPPAPRKALRTRRGAPFGAVHRRQVHRGDGRTHGHPGPHVDPRERHLMSIAGSGLSGAIEVLNAKPNLSLVKVTIPGIGEILDGFDGTTGWMVSPMTGPMVYQGKELADRKFDADYYGDLHDPSRYSSMRTVEETTFEGRPCYKVSLTRVGGGEDIEYYDVATGLKAGSIMSRATPMGEVSSTTVLSGASSSGLAAADRHEPEQHGGQAEDVTVTTVEYDKVPPSAFEAPAQIRALIK